MDTPPTTDRILTHGRVCRQCRYDLGGLLDTVCPECGADLTSQMLPGVLRAITPAERAAAHTVLCQPSKAELRATQSSTSVPRWLVWLMFAGLAGMPIAGSVADYYELGNPAVAAAFMHLALASMVVAVSSVFLITAAWLGWFAGFRKALPELAINKQRELIEADLTKGIVEELHVVATHELVCDSDRGFRVYLKLANGWILGIRNDAAPSRIRQSNIDGDDEVTGQNVRLVILPTSRACVALSTSGPACIRVRADGITPKVFAYRWASPAVFFPGESPAFKRAFWQLGVFARPIRPRPAVVKRNGATP